MADELSLMNAVCFFIFCSFNLLEYYPTMYVCLY